MIARKVAPALAVGCTFVAKPAEDTPLSALAMAVLAERAGVPAGVFSVVTTNRSSDIGKEFTSNPKVRKLTFTGSTQVGRILLRQGADQVMKMSMELGGNAPFIVFDDANLDDAVEGAMISKYRNNGQTCVCANRIYVQEGVYDAFAEKLAAAVAKMNVGDGFDEGVTTGPLITQAAVSKVEQHIADATAKGAFPHRQAFAMLQLELAVVLAIDGGRRFDINLVALFQGSERVVDLVGRIFTLIGDNE